MGPRIERLPVSRLDADSDRGHIGGASGIGFAEQSPDCGPTCACEFKSRPNLRRGVQIGLQLAGDPCRSASNLHQCIQKANLRGFSPLRCAKTGHLTGFEATNPHKSPHNMHRCKLRADLCGPDARWGAVCIGMQVGFWSGAGMRSGYRFARQMWAGPNPADGCQEPA